MNIKYWIIMAILDEIILDCVINEFTKFALAQGLFNAD